MVLPIGSAGPSAHELLTGEVMDALLETLRERFQCVVIDTAPALPVAATRMLAAKADAVVLAVHWRRTSEGAVRAALRLLRDGEVRLAGVALTRVDLRQMARYGSADAAGLFKKFRQYYA
jgi:Mrp family chromosome partitioning ATPase